MKNDNNPPICYKCKHRCPVAGDTHSSCNHPETKMDTDDNSLASLLSIFASVGRSEPQIGVSSLSLNIDANEHGIRSGWFNWPWNFDPVWLKNCDGFEEEE